MATRSGPSNRIEKALDMAADTVSRLASENLRLRKQNDLLKRRLAKVEAQVATHEKRAARRPAAQTLTFHVAAETYIRAHEPGWRSLRHAEQWPQSLAAYVYPVFGERPVDRVDTAMVLKALEPIWRTKTETASRVRGRIERILDWAVTAGYRGSDVPNPARWRGHLENMLPAPAKIMRSTNWPALPYPELPAFMSKVAADELGIGGLALYFTILTAARSGEVVGARWCEIDLDNRLWTVPATRMKAGREHRVPLSQPALDVLSRIRAAEPEGRYLIRRRPISRTPMLLALHRIRPGLSVHGFRSTFSDWVAETTMFPSEVREMALAHAIANQVEAAYRRGDLFDKRRQLMEAWGAFCTGAGEVVRLVAAGERARR